MEIETMSVKAFREQGYLQEVNRRFLHPLGLALSINADGDETFGEIWDYRDDPEGLLFGENMLKDQSAKERALRINTEFAEKAKVRTQKHGGVVQLIPGIDDYILT